MSKRIQVRLNTQSIENAIREVERYKRWLTEKTKEFLGELARQGYETASFRFAWAVYDGTNDVTCHIEERSDKQVAVVALGSAVLFIEFGTGVLYPDNHPEAAQNGMVRGGYGSHLGLSPGGWRYEGDPGTNGEIITSGKHAGKVHTYGNPANMSLYQAVRDVEQRFTEIARRVFVYG